jgi:hypothetical protein
MVCRDKIDMCCIVLKYDPLFRPSCFTLRSIQEPWKRGLFWDVVRFCLSCHTCLVQVHWHWDVTCMFLDGLRLTNAPPSLSLSLSLSRSTFLFVISRLFVFKFINIGTSHACFWTAFDWPMPSLSLSLSLSLSKFVSVCHVEPVCFQVH